MSSVDLEELKQRIGTALISSGKRVVVFIDDIDRLDRREIHAILKLIKLSASFSNTAYVLAFDDEVVAASLGERYGAGDPAAGRSFLEKIIQVPLHLPDAEALDLRTLSFEGVDDVLNENGIALAYEDVEAFVNHFVQGVLPALRTPRQAKRYINAIRFAIPLLKDEVHIVDQLLIEGLRSAFPNLYLSIRVNQDAYLGERMSFGNSSARKDAIKKTVEDGMNALTATERQAAMHVLRVLFPTLNGVFGGSYYDPLDWNKKWTVERRIASDAYCRRYFQYSVPKRDVSDARISDLFRAAGAKDAAIMSAFYEDVTKRQAWSRALDKIFARVEELDSAGARALALSLAEAGEAAPQEKGPFAEIMSSANRVGNLAARLVQAVGDKADRLAAARDVVAAIMPLTLGAEVLRWISFKSDEPDNTAALDEPEFNEVAGVLAKRIAAVIMKDPNYSKYGRQLGRLLWIWKTHGPAGEMVGFLTGRFKRDPTEAAMFLDAFIGRGWGLENGLSHKQEFGRSEFDSVASLIEPDVVLAALKQKFGALLDGSTFAKCHELKDDEKTACHFVAIHKKVQDEAAAKAAENTQNDIDENLD